jgi:hypothetical protein
MPSTEFLSFSGQVILNEKGRLVVDIQNPNGIDFPMEYSGHPSSCPLPPGENVQIDYMPIVVTNRTVALSIAAGMPFDPTIDLAVLSSNLCDTCGLNRCTDPDKNPICNTASAQRGTSY